MTCGPLVGGAPDACRCGSTQVGLRDNGVADFAAKQAVAGPCILALPAHPPAHPKGSASVEEWLWPSGAFSCAAPSTIQRGHKETFNGTRSMRWFPHSVVVCRCCAGCPMHPPGRRRLPYWRHRCALQVRALGLATPPDLGLRPRPLVAVPAATTAVSTQATRRKRCASGLKRTASITRRRWCQAQAGKRNVVVFASAAFAGNNLEVSSTGHPGRRGARERPGACGGGPFGSSLRGRSGLKFGRPSVPPAAASGAEAPEAAPNGANVRASLGDPRS